MSDQSLAPQMQRMTLEDLLRRCRTAPCNCEPMIPPEECPACAPALEIQRRLSDLQKQVGELYLENLALRGARQIADELDRQFVEELKQEMRDANE